MGTMATPSSPFSFVRPLAGGLLAGLADVLRPPGWLVAEAQQRALLLANHVLQQEPEAQQRLVRQRGRVLAARWRGTTVRLRITPAGLLEQAEAAASADLTLTLVGDAAGSLARTLLRGERPAVRIEGDVLLAAEVNWLADNLRWDIEDDLARIVGDVPAHAIAVAARRVAEALRGFVADPAAGSPAVAATTAGTLRLAAPPASARPDAPGAGV